MTDDFNSGKIKSRFSKKNIVSPILGIVSIMILVIGGWYQYGEIFRRAWWIPLITFLMALTGLILGIMGSKSPIKKFSILGIILGIIGLLISIYAYLAGIMGST